MPKMYSSVSPKGQVTIPAEIRQLLGLRPKDRIVFEVEDGVVRIARAESGLARWRGAAGKLPREMNDHELSEVIAEEVAKKYVRKFGVPVRAED
jgi:AbrB family looped-hinge helix DNA binding protein